MKNRDGPTAVLVCACACVWEGGRRGYDVSVGMFLSVCLSVSLSLSLSPSLSVGGDGVCVCD